MFNIMVIVWFYAFSNINTRQNASGQK